MLRPGSSREPCRRSVVRPPGEARYGSLAVLSGGNGFTRPQQCLRQGAVRPRPEGWPVSRRAAIIGGMSDGRSRFARPRAGGRRANAGRASLGFAALLCSCLAATLVACSGAAGPSEPPTPPPSAAGPSVSSGRPTFEPAPSLPPGLASIAPQGSTVDGEVPAAILDAARADLRGRVGSAAEAATVVVARSVVWSDGSLGCPVPGRAYTQALVPGFWIVLEAGGRRYDYRAGRSGSVRLCERPFPPASGGLGSSASG